MSKIIKEPISPYIPIVLVILFIFIITMSLVSQFNENATKIQLAKINNQHIQGNNDE